MNHYAAILNLEEADSYCLQQDELFDHELQSTLSHSLFLGYGQTEYTALTAALRTLQDSGILKTYKCGLGADTILESCAGKNALRHLWLYNENNGKKRKLCALPGHSCAVAFGRKYNLNDEATEELSIIFNELLGLEQ